MRPRQAPCQFLGPFPVIVDLDEDVVDDQGIAGAGLGCLDPLVLGEARGDAEILVADCPLRWDLVSLGHLDNEVGRAEVPAFGEHASGRNGPLVAKRGVLVDPGQESGGWRVVRLRSFSKWPYRGSACQGGMRQFSTTSPIMAAWRLASS